MQPVATVTVRLKRPIPRRGSRDLEVRRAVEMSREEARRRGLDPARIGLVRLAGVYDDPDTPPVPAPDGSGEMLAQKVAVYRCDVFATAPGDSAAGAAPPGDTV